MQKLLSKPVVEEINRQTLLESSKQIDLGVDPHLAVVLVGTNPDSLKYVELKQKKAKELGIIVSVYALEEDCSFEELSQTLKFLAEDDEIHGIIVQLPLPETFSEKEVDMILELIPTHKDVDGLRGDWKKLTYGFENIKDLLKPRAIFLPPMVLAVLSLMDEYQIDPRGLETVIIGEGRLVGTPLKDFFIKIGCSVTSVNEDTEKIFEYTKKADILISGTGQKDLVTYQWLKDDAIVFDCAADIHHDSVEQIAKALAPSVGGVGPLTVAWLLNNTVGASAN